MTKLSRRAYLAGAAAAITSTIAGCGGFGQPSSSDEENNPNTGDGNPSDGTGDSNPAPPEPDPDTDIADLETLTGPDGRTIPTWNAEEDGDAGAVQIFADPDDVNKHAEENMSRPAYEEIQTIIDRTDFETQTLIHVESVAPTTCYTRSLGDITVEDEAIIERVTINDTSEEAAEDDDTVCGHVQKFPSVFFRVTFDNEPVTDAQFTVTNAHGVEETLPQSSDD